jgi:hypothetical protein
VFHGGLRLILQRYGLLLIVELLIVELLKCLPLAMSQVEMVVNQLI